MIVSLVRIVLMGIMLLMVIQMVISDGDSYGDKLRNDCVRWWWRVVNMACVMVLGKSDMRAGGKYH